MIRCCSIKLLWRNSIIVPRRCFRRTAAAVTAVTTTKTVVVVALSGGVDSGVAAALLQQQYSQHVVTGIHMSNWNAVTHDDDSVTACSSETDWNDAAATAQHLNLPVTRVTRFESDYWCHVFEPYIQQLYTTGAMGNPDIACNTHVKFGALLSYCLQTYGGCNNNTTKLATGHYARLWHRMNTTDTEQHETTILCNGKTVIRVPACVEESCTTTGVDAAVADLDWLRQWGNDSTTPLLLAAADPSKDQSYFLSGCSASSFRHVLFPLGEIYKTTTTGHGGDDDGLIPTVRELAANLQLPVAHKRESMGICFVGKRQAGFRSFVADYLPVATQKLQFRDVDTGVIVHQGDAPAHAVLYTPGQGAKLSGSPQKYFVVDNHWKDRHRRSDNNTEYHTVSICAGTHHPALYSDSLYLSRVHWLSDTPPIPLLQTKRIRLQCRIRHLQPLVDCTIWQHEDGGVQVHFDTAVRGITRGQTAVFYIGLVCLGGGPIAASGPTYFEQGRQLPEVLHPAGHNDFSTRRQTTECKAA
jgi:tRNA U34 2-thiouridine synthase MnmA/TrmU